MVRTLRARETKKRICMMDTNVWAWKNNLLKDMNDTHTIWPIIKKIAHGLGARFALGSLLCIYVCFFNEIKNIYIYI
jgi:hypothetical protein